MLHSQRSFMLATIIALCLTACAPAELSTPSASNRASTISVRATAPQPILKRQLTPFEQTLMRKPGDLHGSQFTENKLQERLATVKRTQSADATFRQLLQWLHEDYRRLVMETANFSTDINPTTQQPANTIILEKPTHFAILLDASGSMAEKVNASTKMQSAKKAIATFVSKLPPAATISLRVYGHKGTNQATDKALSCRSTEAIFPASTYNATRFSQALDAINPSGWTPIAASLAAVEKDVPPQAEEVHLYLISDGEETCGGNPVQLMSQLRQSAIRPHVHVIGFRIDDAGQKALKQMAEAGMGTFTYVDSGEELDRFLDAEHQRLMREWLHWGQKNGSEALRMRQQKMSELDRLLMRWKSTADREMNRMKLALRYLEQTGYPPAQRDKLKQLIQERSDQFGAYRTETRRSLQAAIQKSGWEAWSNIWDEGARQMRKAMEN
ncbi:VWA domain-containing protein [Laceyella tengchongensis]